MRKPATRKSPTPAQRRDASAPPPRSPKRPAIRISRALHDAQIPPSTPAVRKRGRPRKLRPDASPTEQALHSMDAAIQPRRRRISSKDRIFIRAFVESNFVDAEGAARTAGYREKGIGWRLADRLSDLIDVERVRASAGKVMSVEEALQLCAERARNGGDEKVQLGYLQLFMRAQGMLSDKPMPSNMRRALQAQIAEVVDRVQRGLKTGQRAKLKAMLGTAVGVEVEVEGGARKGEGAGETPSSDDVVDGEVLALPASPDANDSDDHEPEP